MDGTLLEKRISLLKASRLFRGISPDKVDFIAKSGMKKVLASGDVLYREGFAGAELYLIRSGRIKLTQATADGREALVWCYGPAELVGCLTESCCHSSTATAIFPSTALCWRSDELLRNVPAIRHNIMEIMAERVQRFERRLFSLTAESVADRVKRVLLEMSGVESESDTVNLGIGREDVAQMVGATMHTVSRILSTWEREGAISSERGKYKCIVVSGRKRLEEVSFDWDRRSDVAAGIS